MSLTKERIITELKVILANKYHLINIQEEIIVKENGKEIARKTNIHHIPPSDEGRKKLDELGVSNLLNIDSIWPNLIKENYKKYIEYSTLTPGS